MLIKKFPFITYEYVVYFLLKLPKSCKNILEEVFIFLKL